MVPQQTWKNPDQSPNKSVLRDSIQGGSLDVAWDSAGSWADFSFHRGAVPSLHRHLQARKWCFQCIYLVSRHNSASLQDRFRQKCLELKWCSDKLGKLNQNPVKIWSQSLSPRRIPRDSWFEWVSPFIGGPFQIYTGTYKPGNGVLSASISFLDTIPQVCKTDFDKSVWNENGAVINFETSTKT